MSSTANLYDDLFSDDDDLDVGMLAINEMYGHLNFDEMSDYISLDSYNKKFSSNNDKMISIAHFNIRSLETNLIPLEALLSSLQQKPDIIAFSETWLDNENVNNLTLEGYYSHHVVREKRERGGVSIFIRDGLHCEKVDEYSYVNSLIEICTIRLTINDSSYIVAAIYRPSNKYTKIKEFRKEMVPLLKNPIFKKSNTIFLGDFNIDLLIHSHHQDTNEYLNMFQTFGYIPLITRATRFPQGKQMGNPSLLDHIFVNFTPPAYTGILHFDLTDHLPTTFNFYLPQRLNSSFKSNSECLMKKINLNLLENLLIQCGRSYL